jgi:hypothetical protein
MGLAFTWQLYNGFIKSKMLYANLLMGLSLVNMGVIAVLACTRVKGFMSRA